MALTKFRAAPLPNPPPEYDPQYVRQLIRVLENYFSQLDSKTPNFAESYTADNFYGGFLHGDGTNISVPYNQFSSDIDQTAAAIDQAYALELENTVFTNGIYIGGANDTQITFTAPGIYTITYSLAFQNPTNDAQTIDVWFRYDDGTGAADVPNSTRRFTVPPRKSTGDPSHLVAASAFTGLADAAGVYVEIMWRVSDTNVSMEHLPAVTYSAGVTPDIPATPSAIVQANFVSKPAT
jgi:hypothetical protein